MAILGSITNAPTNLYIGDGTVSLPAIAFGSDTDTGLYRAGANDLRIATNGVDTLRLVAGDVLINNGDFTISRSGVGGTVNSIQRNTDNTNAASHAQHTISTGGASAGDPFLEFLVTSQTAFSMGVDNSDADKFKLSGSATLGTNDWFVMDTSGKIGINTATTTANYQMRMDSTGKLGLSIYSTSSASAAYLFLENDSANTWNFAVNGSTAANPNKMDLAYNGTAKVRFDLNGPVNFSDGTAASPAMSFISETATGVYRPGAGRLAVALSGTNRLDLNGTALTWNNNGSHVYFYLDRANTSSEGLVIYSTAGVTKAAVGLDNDATDDLCFYSNGNLGTPVMRILAAGTAFIPTTDNAIDNGNATHRWANVWGTTIHSGDIQMENDWRITEGEKIGHPEEGVMFLSPSGKKYKIHMTEVE